MRPADFSRLGLTRFGGYDEGFDDHNVDVESARDVNFVDDAVI